MLFILEIKVLNHETWTVSKHNKSKAKKIKVNAVRNHIKQ